MPYAVQVVLRDDASTIRTGPAMEDEAAAEADLENFRQAMRHSNPVSGVKWYAGSGMDIRSASVVEVM
jgi:hypothetical protein